MNISKSLLFFIGIVAIVALGVFFFRYKALGTEYEDYQTIPLSKAPEPIQTKYSNTKANTGYYSYLEDNTSYVLINMGEVNTGGYKVEIEKVLKSEDKWTIKAKFIEPGPNDIVIQVISYPATVVKIPEKVNNVNVIADGKKLLKLN